jgi:hypothetical protein
MLYSTASGLRPGHLVLEALKTSSDITIKEFQWKAKYLA